MVKVSPISVATDKYLARTFDLKVESLENEYDRVCGFRLMYLMHENANMDLTDVVVKN
jgi:hypothetical protein